jgi:hypothetical protein
VGLRGGQAPRFLTTAAQRCVVIDKAQPEARPKWHVGTRPIPPAWGQRRTLQTLADTGSPLRGRNLAVSTVDGAASRTRPAAPLVSTTHGPLKCVSRTPSMSSSPPSERRRRSSSRPTMHVPSHIGSELARRRTPARTGATSPTTASGRGASAATRSRPATTCARLIAVIPVLTSGESALFGATSVS